MYSIENSPTIDEIFKKLGKKNPRQIEIIAKKLQEIVENPHRFKPLGSNMKGFRRVHFGHYVLTFSIDEKNKIVTLEDYDHHANIYRN